MEKDLFQIDLFSNCIHFKQNSSLFSQFFTEFLLKQIHFKLFFSPNIFDVDFYSYHNKRCFSFISSMSFAYQCYIYVSASMWQMPVIAVLCSLNHHFHFCEHFFSVFLPFFAIFSFLSLFAIFSFPVVFHHFYNLRLISLEFSHILCHFSSIARQVLIFLMFCVQTNFNVLRVWAHFYVLNKLSVNFTICAHFLAILNFCNDFSANLSFFNAKKPFSLKLSWNVSASVNFHKVFRWNDKKKHIYWWTKRHN